MQCHCDGGCFAGESTVIVAYESHLLQKRLCLLCVEFSDISSVMCRIVMNRYLFDLWFA